MLASLLYWGYSGKLRGLFPLMYIDNKVIDESGDCAKQQGVKQNRVWGAESSGVGVAGLLFYSQ